MGEQGMGHNGGPALRDGNWVAISREIIDHHIVGAGQTVTPADRNRGAFSRLESWIDLLMLANFSERKISTKGVTTILGPGQTLAGRAFLARRWNWTEKTVRLWLDRLQKELMITLACETLKQGHSQGHTPNVLTICNWSKYQIAEVAEGPPLGWPEGHPGATQGPNYNKETREQDSEVKKESDVPFAADAAPVPLDALTAFSEWNAMAQRIGLSVARSLTPGRRKSLLARLREHGGLEAWRVALANVERSAFLRGQNPKEWRADLDFLLQASRFAKVVDGGYGNGAHGDVLKPKETYLERLERHVMAASERLDENDRRRIR